MFCFEAVAYNKGRDLLFIVHAWGMFTTMSPVEVRAFFGARANYNLCPYLRDTMRIWTYVVWRDPIPHNLNSIWCLNELLFPVLHQADELNLASRLIMNRQLNLVTNNQLVPLSP